MKPTIEQLVKIGWADAIERDGTWISQEEAERWADEDNWIVEMVGWILKETNDYILIATRYLERDDVFSGVFKIPKPWIAYRHNLMELIPEKDE